MIMWFLLLKNFRDGYHQLVAVTKAKGKKKTSKGLEMML